MVFLVRKRGHIRLLLRTVPCCAWSDGSRDIRSVRVDCRMCPGLGAGATAGHTRQRHRRVACCSPTSEASDQACGKGEIIQHDLARILRIRDQGHLSLDWWRLVSHCHRSLVHIVQRGAVAPFFDTRLDQVYKYWPRRQYQYIYFEPCVATSHDFTRTFIFHLNLRIGRILSGRNIRRTLLDIIDYLN